MPSALKRGCKHQRQRQAQKKMGEAYIFHTCSPPIFPFDFLLPKLGIHSFKFVGSPLQNERDYAHPDLENLSFFFFLSPLFFSLFFFLLFFLLLHIFCSSFLPLFLSELTPFCAPSVSGIPPISLGLPQLHKHSFIPKVHSWPHLLLSLTTKYPSGPKVGCKKPITWPKTGPNPFLGLIWGLWA